MKELQDKILNEDTLLIEVLREINFMENIKEITPLMPKKYNLQKNIDDYMNNGMNKYEAMQTITEGFRNKLKGIEQCIQWNFARNQRKKELTIGKGFAGTKGYEVIGCYLCNGYNIKCNTYYTKNKLKALANKYKAMDDLKIEGKHLIEL